MLEKAITFPANDPASVAELPTCQCTLPQLAPPIRFTPPVDDVISVLENLNMYTPLPFSVSVPVRLEVAGGTQ